MLCYIYQRSVRILDVHGASETEDVIDMVKLMAELPGYGANTTIDDVGVIFGHENGILTMRLHTGSVNRGNPLMVVIDVRRDFVATSQSPSRKIMVLQEPLPPHPQHAMTDGRYLVCVNIPQNPKEWTLKCYDLSNTEAPAKIIALNEFLPEGDKCRFKLLDGLVYAIYTKEEEAFVSKRDRKKKLYYHCCRFPIGCPITQKPEDFLGSSSYTPIPARLEAVKLYRGAGQFFWKQVCIDLVKDEQTGEVFIVESASLNEIPESDTPYRRLIFPKTPEHTVSSWETKINDIFHTVDESDYVHHQSIYSKQLEDIRNHLQPSQSVMDVTFEDLEEGSDEQVLHLYSGTAHQQIWRFPPQGAPHELRDFLTKSSRTSFILALPDERSLMVMIFDPNVDQFGRADCQLILVNFDSGINFPGLKDLALDNPSDMVLHDDRTMDARGASLSENMRQLQVELLQLNEKARREAKAPDARKAEAHPWFSTRDALYLSIGQGFRFPPKPTAG